MTPSIATLLILLGIFILWLVQKLVGLVVAVIRFLNGDETALGRYFHVIGKNVPLLCWPIR